MLKIAFGIWDHVKNHGDHGAENWALEWVGALPGKRESRRYVGDHVLTQNDVRAEGRFDDVVAYGGWPMDDHHPAGLRHPGEPTIFHPAPSPFGIPYRCLYSRSIDNLFCAGRNISATHAALSSTRVMATCATLGQAVGTAAAIATDARLTPRQVGQTHINQIQQALLANDCYLPWIRRTVPALSAQADLRASCSDPQPLRNGWDRPIGSEMNAWSGEAGAWTEYRFTGSKHIRQARIVFDSNLDRSELNLPCSYPLDPPLRYVPTSLVKAFQIDVLEEGSGWTTMHRKCGNYQRLVRVRLDAHASGIRLKLREAWGDDSMRVFAFDVQ